MIDISVNYMGLSLKSPFIAASSGYTSNVEEIIALEKAGAGAIVLKSLFEEQILNEAKFIEQVSTEHPENADFIYYYTKEYSIAKYIELIKEAKKAVKIPVIASINCYEKGNWISFAKEIENAGADGLEINLYSLPLTLEKSGTQIEKDDYSLISSITSIISIPVAVKIGDNYTNITEFVHSLMLCKAKAVVMFNRFFRPDINLNTMSVVPASPFSSNGEYTRELRWIAITSSCVKSIDISASTGVLNPNDGIKLMLAGASTVQLCSAFYKQGVEVLKQFNTSLENFMQQKGYSKTSDFIGKLNYSNIPHPEKYERVQFLKTTKMPEE